MAIRAKAAERLGLEIDRMRLAHVADWPLKVGDVLLGRIDSGALVLAALSREEKTTKEHQCEAFFYIGSPQLLNHDDAAAKASFEKSVATNAYAMVELQSAAAELAFLSRGGAVVAEPAHP